MRRSWVRLCVYQDTPQDSKAGSANHGCLCWRRPEARRNERSISGWSVWRSHDQRDFFGSLLEHKHQWLCVNRLQEFRRARFNISVPVIIATTELGYAVCLTQHSCDALAGKSCVHFQLSSLDWGGHFRIRGWPTFGSKISSHRSLRVRWGQPLTSDTCERPRSATPRHRRLGLRKV
jgi:hypothetical protein